MRKKVAIVKKVERGTAKVLESSGLETAKSISWRYLKSLLDKVNELLEAILLATPPPDDAAMLPLQEEPEMLPLQVPEKPQIVDAIAVNPVDVTKAFDAASKFLAQQEKSQAQKRKYNSNKLETQTASLNDRKCIECKIGFKVTTKELAVEQAAGPGRGKFRCNGCYEKLMTGRAEFKARQAEDK